MRWECIFQYYRIDIIYTRRRHCVRVEEREGDSENATHKKWTCSTRTHGGNTDHIPVSAFEEANIDLFHHIMLRIVTSSRW